MCALKDKLYVTCKDLMYKDFHASGALMVLYLPTHAIVSSM